MAKNGYPIEAAILFLVFGTIIGVIFISPIIFPDSGDACQETNTGIVKIITIDGKIGGEGYQQIIQDTIGDIWILDKDAGNIDDLTIGEDYIITFRHYTFDKYPTIIHIEKAGDLCVCL